MNLFSHYRLHHVGVVQPTLAAADELVATLGMVEDYRGFVEQWSCWCIFLKGESTTVIEIVVPEGGPLARFNKGVGGVHHFAYEVPDILRTSSELVERGLQMLEPAPIRGAGPFLCNFIHPFSLRGVQIELVQVLPGEREDRG